MRCDEVVSDLGEAEMNSDKGDRDSRKGFEISNN